MAFAVFADGSANLSGSMLKGIHLLPCTYTLDGELETYEGDADRFDAHAYYEKLRSGKIVQTSLLNTQLFLSSFAPILKQGLDVIYIAMSSGISGTYNAAMNAAQELMEKFSGRIVHIVDSLGCGFGNGMLALRAERLQVEGVDTQEASRILDGEVQHMCQYFTVDDLDYLKRTGRVNGVTAKIATVLNIKPILFGNAEGQIVSCEKVRGRRKAIEALAAKYRQKRMKAKHPEVFISHGDCLQDAELLASMVKEITPEAEVTVSMHEPFSGGHVGPGMLGLFFHGTER